MAKQKSADTSRRCSETPFYKGFSSFRDLPSEVPSKVQSHLPSEVLPCVLIWLTRKVAWGGRWREVDGRCRNLTSRAETPFYKGISGDDGRLGGLFRNSAKKNNSVIKKQRSSQSAASLTKKIKISSGPLSSQTIRPATQFSAVIATSGETWKNYICSLLN